MLKPIQHRIDVRFKMQASVTKRVLDISESFGVGLNEREFVVFDNVQLETLPGDVIYITGESGSGKSQLLKHLIASYEANGVACERIEDVALDDRPIVEQVGKDTSDSLKIFNVAGLNDANLYIRKPSELSDGQRYRLRLAKLVESDKKVWVADEFGAVLDRTTAKAVAYGAQRLARSVGATLIVATTHEDLLADLNPSLIVTKKYAKSIRIQYRSRDEWGDY